MTTWRIRVACWIPNSTNTRSQYVTHIAFPLSQWLHEHTSVLRYTYIAWLVYRKFPESQHYQGDAYFAIVSRMALWISTPLALVRHTDCSPLSARCARFSLQPLHHHPNPTTYLCDEQWQIYAPSLCVSEKRRILFPVDRRLTQPYLFLTNICIPAQPGAGVELLLGYGLDGLGFECR